jgi:PAS domain S-box-containing protein
VIDSDQRKLEVRVLVLAPTPKDADLTRSIIGRAGVECVSCESLESVVEHLEAGAGAVLLVEEAVAPGRSNGLERWLKRQPPWSDLPVLILARPGADSAGVAQSMDLLGNVTVLERPTRVAAFVSAVRTALRARQRQYQIRDYLVEQERGIEERARLAAIVASSDDAIISKSLDGVIRSWNAGAERIFGYSADEAIGQSITMLIPPERLEEETTILARLRAGERIDHFETVRVARDGRRIDISLTVSPIRDSAGTITGASKVARDITERKRAEKQLRESEQNFRLMADAVPVLIWVSDVTKGCTWFNKSWRDFSGRPMEELLGDGWARDVHPDDLDRCMEIYSTHFDARRPFSMEYRLKRHDGEYRWVVDNGRPYFASGGAFVGYIGGCVDLTDRKRAEQTLREVQAQLESELKDTKLLQRMSAEIVHQENPHGLYEQILETAVAIMRSDFASMQMLYPERGQKGELRLLAFRGFNPEAAKFWEWVRADSSCTCGVALHTGARCVAADVETCEFMAGTADRETYLATGIRAVQSTPLVSRTGKLLGMISTHWRQPHQPPERDLRLLDVLARQAADLIERVRAEQALRESEERFRMLADNMSQLAWTCDTLGNCTWYNKRWLDYTGLAFEDMKGWDWSKVQHPDHLDRVVERVKQSSATGEFWEDTFPLRGKDGEYRWFLSQAVPIRDENGQIRCWFGTNTDVTERIRMEEALKEADRRKDEFLAVLAHELRNPLAPIRNSLHILRLTGQNDPASERVGEMMERQVNHMVRLVDDLLEVSRITRGKIELRRELVGVAAIVRGAVETSRPAIVAAGHQLALSIPPEPLALDADPVRLTQVVANLLNNAAKYTEPGGQIWLTVRNEGDEVAISVRDTGLGIPPEMLARVFDLFTQVDRHTERAQGGLGIGLTLVKSLVELHGGRVDALSEGAGRGSEFVVHLPLASTITSADQPALDAGPSTTLPPRRVLVVDDNQDAADSVGMLLSLLGLDVHVVYNGPAALEAAASFKPAVVLMDIGMPGMDGYEVARRIRLQPETEDVILIALTGWGQEEDRQRSLSAGFDHHLIKPTNVSALETLFVSLDAHAGSRRSAR